MSLSDKRSVLQVLCLAAIIYGSLIDIACAESGYAYDSHGRRDPFVPLVGVAVKRGALTIKDVTAIDDITFQGMALDAKGNRIALLNNEMIQEGQTIGLVTIRKVAGSTVTLTIDENEYNLKVYREEIE
ncbi:MAG: hypothetical protein ABID09_03615 [Candidatus Omnitrophota bacterium]